VSGGAQTFVGLDGEGIADKYVLIQDSQGGELCNLHGLSTVALFDWLLKRNRELSGLTPCFVGFVTSYDVNMMLRDVDDETLRAVFQTDDKESVYWREWEFLYIPRKVFKLRRDGEMFTLYDVFTFFGSSFVKACEGILGDVPRLIREGKAERVAFKREDLPRIKRYNALECQYLVKLCDRLREILESQDIKIRKWHGPGAVAEYVLGKRGINLHTEYPCYSEDHVPLGLLEAWDCAYYGGRFETMGIGSFRNVFVADINSAYPFALSMLTKLDYAVRWTREEKPRGFVHGFHAVYLASWQVENGAPFGPLPWRHHSGRILYPLNGLGWYWRSEIEAAWRAFPGCIKLHEVWYQNEGEPSILQREIPRIYNLRHELKERKDAGEYALKIALNSIYGKLAQHVGFAPFKCMPWAGQVTACTRGMLLDATRKRSRDILAFATDSVVSRSDLALSNSHALGDWKSEKHERFLVLMNGFYRMDDVTESKSALRGVGKDFAWNEAIESLNTRQYYEYQMRAFVTHSMAIHFPNKFGADRLKFVNVTKRLSPFEGTRREFDSTKIDDWERENVLSKPVRLPSVELSFPSSLSGATVFIEEGEE
jgi:hypothetical protein